MGVANATLIFDNTLDYGIGKIIGEKIMNSILKRQLLGQVFMWRISGNQLSRYSHSMELK
jgi:hypothetical protein